MNELSLFSGAGGGLLGTKLLGFRPIGYVEWDGYCQAVLAQRIKDGFLEEATIFGDIREFVKSGAAREYRGFADVVTAGFPCQPFSVAGKQKGADDERNMWPATADVLREVRPRYALLENVPGLLATGYCERIFADLAEMGFDARWGVFSAAGVGAPHLRERLFVVAYARHARPQARWIGGEQTPHGSLLDVQPECGSPDVAHSKSERCREARIDSQRYPERSACGGNALADPEMRGWGEGRQIKDVDSERGRDGSTERSSSLADSSEPRLSESLCGELASIPCSSESFSRRQSSGGNAATGVWWNAEPNVGRVANGVASRVDRLKALGNGQVSAVVARAWRELSAHA